VTDSPNEPPRAIPAAGGRGGDLPSEDSPIAPGPAPAVAAPPRPAVPVPPREEGEKQSASRLTYTVFTTASGQSLLFGDELDLEHTMTADQVRDSVRALLRSKRDVRLPPNYDLIIYLPGDYRSLARRFVTTTTHAEVE
jgi:hypothetical protein